MQLASYLTSLHLAPGPLPAGGQWCPAPHLKYVPPFHVNPLVVTYILHSILKMWPPSDFWPPLLLNPGDRPVWPTEQFEFESPALEYYPHAQNNTNPLMWTMKLS